MADESEMKTGAVVMMDALGFKGLWRRTETPEVVLAKLRKLRRDTEEAVEYLNDSARQYPRAIQEAKALFLSDTIVLGVHMRPVDASFEQSSATGNAMEALAVAFVCGIASSVQAEALASHPPLLYRGAVAFGTLAIDQNFYVGEAVDEAAECMEAAQGAFVWLTSSALARADGVAKALLVPWKVPLKQGGYIRTVCATPFSASPSGGVSKKERLAAAERSFGARPSLDVLQKKQNTMRFLRHCLDTPGVRKGRKKGRQELP